jgi:hypothetical protein
MLFTCLFCLLSRGSVYTVLYSDKYLINRVCLVVCLLVSQPGGMDWQRHLLGYHEQLFLQYRQTSFDACLLVSFGAWLLSRSNYD